MNKKMILIVICILLLSPLVFNFSLYHREQKELDKSYLYEEPLEADEKDEKRIIILKIAHSLHESHPQHMALVEKFVPIVEEGSDWNIRVELYPNNQLAREKEYIQGVRYGTIEMCIGGQTLEEILPRMKVLALPYLFDDYDQVKVALSNQVGDQVIQGIKHLGIRSLAWSLDGFRQVSISTYEDPFLNYGNYIKLKLATSFLQSNIDTLKSMNFDVSSLSIEDTTIALNQRLVDGHDYPVLSGHYNGWYGDKGTIAMTNHSITPSIYMISNKFWDTLPQKYRDLIAKASKESANYEIELLEKQESEILETLKDRGIDIQYPDLTRYKENAYDLYSEWLNDDIEMQNILEEILKQKQNI